MNKVNLIGRLTKTAELRYTTNNVAIVKFNLAVNRNFLNSEGEREADFISCIAFRNTAELIAKHFTKGSEIGITGRIQTGSYDNEKGNKVYTTDIVVEEITFVGSKKEKNTQKEEIIETKEETDPFKEFGKEVVISDEDLPF